MPHLSIMEAGECIWKPGPRRIEDLPNEVLFMILDRVLDHESQIEDIFVQETITYGSILRVQKLRLVSKRFCRVAAPLLGKVISKINWPLTENYLTRLRHLISLEGVGPHVKHLNISADLPSVEVHDHLVSVAQSKDELLQPACMDFANLYASEFLIDHLVFVSNGSDKTKLGEVFGLLGNLKTLQLKTQHRLFRPGWRSSGETHATDIGLQNWIVNNRPNITRSGRIRNLNEQKTTRAVLEVLAATGKKVESFFCNHMDHGTAIVSDLQAPIYANLATAMSSVRNLSVTFLGTPSSPGFVENPLYLANYLRMFRRLEVLDLFILHDQAYTTQVMLTTAQQLKQSMPFTLRKLKLTAENLNMEEVIQFIEIFAPSLQHLTLNVGPFPHGEWSEFFFDSRIHRLSLVTLYIHSMAEWGLDGRDYDLNLPDLGVPYEIACRLYVLSIRNGGYEMWCRRSTPGWWDKAVLWTPKKENPRFWRVRGTDVHPKLLTPVA
ncbi:uncharacterized protein K452DRAFT_302412 [Aplosporella prunicola CBS 121167]|uniref:Uncharacterized protein n=1 Tax=Aplosporella prunicola CBS 121167 TaxID=1176127 RepID=A0A6A6AYG1_9PEZI|nr:uncharacterized protein K452DRAFT_302412 [Aplosporella prunicola CBS 121167]KAF2136810.1 hypothetical protein K452DRAFT_302412 [Aplosporella prunicola CBS 121167]